jgi:hypothetical protein
MSDRPQLVLTDSEEEWHKMMFSFSTNEHGDRTLAGLTVEESIEFVEHHRHWNKPSKAEFERITELREKHEAARRLNIATAALREQGKVH